MSSRRSSLLLVFHPAKNRLTPADSYAFVSGLFHLRSLPSDLSGFIVPPIPLATRYLVPYSEHTTRIRRKMVAGTGGEQIALIIYGLILRFHPLTNLSQIVKESTCFMKNSTPSLVDAILANKKTMCFNTHTIPTGVSDCYNLISTTIKGNLPVQDKRKISYRSSRNFDIDKFDSDLQKL